MKKAIALVLTLAMVFTLCACGQKAEQPAATAAPAAAAAPAANANDTSAADPIRIAVVGPMTGADAMYGLGFRSSAEIMAEK